MSIERREQKRLAAHWRAAVQVPQTQEVLHGKTMDVSVGGSCILFDRDIPVGTNCALFLEVPLPERQTKKPISIAAKVMNSALVGNISKFRIGFKFVGLDPEIEALLKSRLV